MIPSGWAAAAASGTVLAAPHRGGPRGDARRDSLPAFIAALAMHAALIGSMWVAVQWHSSASAPAVAELWDTAPPLEPAPEAAAPTPAPEPQPPQPPPPPPAAEAPTPPQADIVQKQEAPRKAESAPPREVPPKKLAKPAPPLPSPAQLRREQAQAQKQHDEEMSRLAAQAGATDHPLVARSSGALSNDYIARIQAAVKSHLSFAVPEDVAPEVYASFDVELLPDGELAAPPQLLKPSGVPGFDDAALKAIIGTGQFPRKDDGTVDRHLRLNLHPQDVR
jgi:colicin import membrane protein